MHVNGCVTSSAAARFSLPAAEFKDSAIVVLVTDGLGKYTEVRFVIRNRCFYNPFAFVVSELIFKNIMYRPLFLVKGKTVF